jgi:hypothetical protein
MEHLVRNSAPGGSKPEDSESAQAKRTMEVSPHSESSLSRDYKLPRLFNVCLLFQEWEALTDNFYHAYLL